MSFDDKISRRRLLMILGHLTAGLTLSAAGLTPRLGLASTGPGSPPKIYDVLVIGAGVSGLAVARQLSSRSVIVLESSAQIGGRVATDRSTFSHPVECGAEYVHIDPFVAPLWRELYNYRLRLAELDKNKSYLYHPAIKDSHAISVVKAAFRWNIYKALRAFSGVKYKGGRDISAEEFLTEHLSQSDRVGLDFKRMILSGHLGAPEEDLSMQGFSSDHIAEQLHAKKEYSVRQGFGALSDHLAQGLDIRTGEKVRRVKREGDHFVVETESGHAFLSRSVCYSASLGVIKSGAIEFSPGLPDSKQAAIDHLDMSHHAKVIMEFRERFWPRKMSMLNRPDQQRRAGKTYFVPYAENSAGHPMLSALIMGRDAIKTFSRGTEDILRDICQDLEECFPSYGSVYELLKRDPSGRPLVKIVNWRENPHTLGGVSYIKKDVSNRLPVKQVRKTYASSQDTPGLFWAGEGAAVFEQPASVHGAHSAGLAASLEIENYLQGKRPLEFLSLAKMYHQKFGLTPRMEWFSEVERKLVLPYDDEASWSERFSSLLYS